MEILYLLYAYILTGCAVTAFVLHHLFNNPRFAEDKQKMRDDLHDIGVAAGPAWQAFAVLALLVILVVSWPGAIRIRRVN